VVKLGDLNNIVALAPLQAEQILKRNRKEWYERDSYPVTLEELRILLAARPDSFKLNQLNGDGTYKHEVIYKKTTFIAIGYNLEQGQI